MKILFQPSYGSRLLGLAFSLLILVGCGQMTDKDRIRVAKVGERYITRGDLYKIIREMPDTARPLIRNRSDLVRILNQQIDNRIKLPLGVKMAKEGKVSIDREYAREMFFRDSGDQEEEFRNMWHMEVPPPGVITPLMEVYGLTPELLQFNKDLVEEGTDHMIIKLQAEQALEVLAVEAFKEGQIQLEEAEIEREYGFMKELFVEPEYLEFKGIRFLESPDAATRSATLRERIQQGEAFDSLLEEYRQKGQEENIQYVIEAGIVNDPKKTHLRAFWEAASGAEEGTIIGPVFLGASQQRSQDPSGLITITEQPPYYLLCVVTESRPESLLSLDQARPQVVMPLIKAKMMHLLREENQVEIYEDKLPDPSHMQGPTAIK
ncbi:MAG: hypothetical protein GX130_00920 [Candidatus Hydrogenedens sp.]|jgi:hypothetical protein|nr:hypothetical protein [Candidatus Hydrogenedens sp.]